jgi:Fe-S cluster assembly iron-binding protein IscA
MKYFQVKVEFKTEDDKGRIKRQSYLYLVDAQSVTEAETRTVKYLRDQSEEDFEIKSAGSSKILEVLDSI